MYNYFIFVGILLLAIVPVFFMITQHNQLVQLQSKANDQWAQVSVLIKRRFDLIPNLLEAIQGYEYAQQEERTLKALIETRNSVLGAKAPEAEMKANQQLTDALNKLFALSEAYPELRSNTIFQRLQEELKETEETILYARQFYNDAAYLYKNKVEAFPSNVVAEWFGFSPIAFFEAETSKKKEC